MGKITFPTRLRADAPTSSFALGDKPATSSLCSEVQVDLWFPAAQNLLFLRQPAPKSLV